MAEKSNETPSPHTQRDPSAKRRPRRHTVLISLAVVLLAAAVLELLLRVYVDIRAAETTTSSAEAGAILPLPDSARVYGLRPGLGPPFSTNNHGFRGEPVDVAKPDGVRRVIMLGDSITFGNAVEWNQTFSYFLQQRLNERAGRRKFEVLNLGVSGYNTSQELATLRDLGLKFSPDLIVLNVCLNDSDPVKTVSPIGLINESGVREPGDINFRTIVESSYLLTMLKYALISAFEEHPDILRALNSPELFIDARTGEKRWSEMKEQMQAIFAVAREHDVPVAMVIYPYSSQIGLPISELEPQRDLLAFAAANGVPALDAGQAYAGQPEDMFADGFIHLSPHGHRVVAEAMQDFLVARGLLPEASPAPTAAGLRGEAVGSMPVP